MKLTHVLYLLRQVESEETTSFTSQVAGPKWAKMLYTRVRTQVFRGTNQPEEPHGPVSLIEAGNLRAHLGPFLFRAPYFRGFLSGETSGKSSFWGPIPQRHTLLPTARTSHLELGDLLRQVVVIQPQGQGLARCSAGGMGSSSTKTVYSSRGSQPRRDNQMNLH